MEIELHICSFQNPFSLFFLFLTECLRIPFLFTLTAVLLEKSLYSFPNSFHLTLSTPSQEGSGSITQDIIFQHPLKPEGGPEGDTNNVFSKEDRLRQRFSPRLT